MTYHASAPPAQASSAHAHFHHQTGGHLNTTVLCPYPQVAAVRFPEHQRNGIPIVHYHCASPINRVPFYPPRSGESNGMSIPQNHSVCRGHLRCIHLPIFSHPQTAGNHGLEDRRQWATASSYAAQPSNQHMPLRPLRLLTTPSMAANETGRGPHFHRVHPFNRYSPLFDVFSSDIQLFFLTRSLQPQPVLCPSPRQGPPDMRSLPPCTAKPHLVWKTYLG